MANTIPCPESNGTHSRPAAIHLTFLSDSDAVRRDPGGGRPWIWGPPGGPSPPQFEDFRLALRVLRDMTVFWSQAPQYSSPLIGPEAGMWRIASNRFPLSS